MDCDIVKIIYDSLFVGGFLNVMDKFWHLIAMRFFFLKNFTSEIYKGKTMFFFIMQGWPS